MKPRFLVLLAASLLAGCAVHDPQELSAARARHVSPALMHKLEHRGVLLPEDVMQLSKRGVSDHLIVQHLERVGVDYLILRDDVASLRKARVSKAVIDALIRASDCFVFCYVNPPPPPVPLVSLRETWDYPMSYWRPGWQPGTCGSIPHHRWH